MIVAPEAFDEHERIRRLHSLRILDTPVDPRFDALVARALALFPGASIAAVSLVDTQRHWFKASRGLSVNEISRSISLCAHALLGSKVMVVPDASRDRRFADNPLVLGAPAIRFYAGAPLTGAVGALCVIGTKARKASEAEIEGLARLALLVDAQLLMHGALCELDRHRGAETPLT